jgi:hypothetical protein
MNNGKDFQGRTHIEKIREYLWQGREFGKTAIMVGSGFSRNAEKVSAKTPKFPLWQDLAKEIYNKLYPNGNFTKDNKKDPVRLATEYEAVHGHESLDDLILKCIPDEKYKPGKLHKLLLTLPWSDIFTTNYDSLLERTRQYIYHRKYDFVLTPKDIPNCMKPRIIKLHGSLPSNSPFIITEEDYRTYPVRFAPFVNLVQESIMENILCMIGFSGNDPNFLSWTGWVRDKLGKSAPPIYLCGVLDLSLPQRKVLDNKNVYLIDLSSLFPESTWPDSDLRRAKALEWFLLTLLYGEPTNKITWPTPIISSNKTIWRPGEGLPFILAGPPPLSNLGEKHPPDRTLQKEDLKGLLEIWKQKRNEYPGWVVAPNGSRESIWKYTEYWIEPVLDAIDELQPPNNLFLLYELNWRLEITLTPLFMNWVDKMTPIINTFNPFPEQVRIEEATIRPDKNDYREWDWVTIRKYWVKLIFSLAREAREDQDENRFRKWLDILKNVINQNPEWQARWFCEEALFYLFRFDQEKVRVTLKKWPRSKNLPFWEIKRASILAELDQLNDAESIAENALNEIRLHLQPYSPDYSLLSKEGWAMILLKAIGDNRNLLMKNSVNPYIDRWEELRAYRCSPLEEIELLGSLVKGENLVGKSTRVIRKEFDPEKEITVQHLPMDFPFFRPAFSFIRMFEEGALPMRCGFPTMFSDLLVNSAKSIELYAPFWAFSTMVRGGEEKKFKEWFGRIRVAALPKDEVEQLFTLINSLKKANKDLVKNPQKLNLLGSSFSQRQVLFLSELISRLCFRLSIKQINQVYQLTVSMYKMSLFQNHLFLHKCVDILFKRLLYGMPQAEILKRMPELLSLPIPSEGGFKVRETQLWPEPFRYICWVENMKLDSNFDLFNWTKPISNLIKIIKTGTPEARKRAILRLIKIYEIEGLSQGEIKDFGKALWAKIDPNTELPSDTSLLYSFFLTLPEEEEGKAKEKLRKYLLSRELPKIIQYSINSEGKKSFTVPFSSSFHLQTQEFLNATLLPINHDKKEERKFINWSTQEAIQILEKVSEFWDNQKVAYREAPETIFFDFKENFREQFPEIMKLMAHIILPRLKDADEKIKKLAKSLLNEMDQEDLVILIALPMTLFLNTNYYEEIVKRIRFGLNSLKEKEVYGSISGLFYWLVYSRKKQIPNPPDDLLNELVNKVLTRSQPGLNFAIKQIAVIIKKFPECFNDSHIESLCISLEYLLKETALPNRRFIETVNELTLRIPISDRPEYRASVVELAFQLYRLFRSRNKDIPEILNKWKEISQNDPLPEVRQIWD